MNTGKSVDAIHRPSNSMMGKPNKMTLFLHKLNESEKENNPLLTEIDSHFNSVDKYLDTSGQLIIGKKIKLAQIPQSQRRPSIKKSPVRKPKKNSERVDNPNLLISTIKQIINHPSEDNSILNQNYYEVVDNKKLKTIFESYKDNSFKPEDAKPSYLPSVIESSLLSQKKYLQIKTEEDSRSKLMAKYLSKQLNKPESDLLMNRIDSFRVKKEVLNSIDNQIPLDQKYGQYKWNISLRRPDGFLGKRDAYINIRSESNPFWAKINERYPMHVQMSIKPTNVLNSEDYLSFKKNPYLRATSADKVKSIELMGNLVIKGQDLYKIEYNNALENASNKILHRVFFLNGKNVLDKDINHSFGNEMLYENYNNTRNKSKPVHSMKSGLSNCR